MTAGPARAVHDPNSWRSLHMVGIGGAGMSGIARLLLARGIAVSGCDLKDSAGLQTLAAAGASVVVGHDPHHLGTSDAVVVSSAIPAENQEVDEARRRGIPVLLRAEVLAALMRGRRTIAVAGTHGKTTTTSMISVMLREAGLDPTYVIGGDLNESGSGAGHGNGDLFVAEADESDGSFLLLSPDIAVVTNVEEDHLDFYASREEIEKAFAEFGRGSGRVVACWDDPGVRRSLDPALVTVRYGIGPDSDLSITDMRLRPDGGDATFRYGDEGVEVSLQVPGRHNLLNAGATLAVAALLEMPLGQAAGCLASFTGVRRRFEQRGVVAGTTFVDDYAHHPTELAATLGSASIDGHRIVAVFQPHRYTRTRRMWRSLGESLVLADVVVVTDVYGAGEQPIPGITGKLVVDAVAEAAPGKRVVYLPRRSEVAPFLAGEVRSGDLVLTLGAGDITMVGDETMDRIKEARR